MASQFIDRKSISAQEIAEGFGWSLYPMTIPLYRDMPETVVGYRPFRMFGADFISGRLCANAAAGWMEALRMEDEMAGFSPLPDEYYRAALA